MSKKIVVLLTVIILVKILIHIPVINYGMPYSLGNSDENDFIGTALNYGATKSLKPIITWYPAFYSYVLTGAIGIYFIILMLTGAIASINDFAVHYLLYPGYFHMLGRILSLLLISLAIIFIYLTGKILKNEKTGIYAAFGLAFSSMLTQRTIWALPSSTIIITLVLSLYFLVHFINKHKSIYMVWAGLFCGLAISTKYNAGPFMLVGFFAIMLLLKEKHDNFLSIAVFKDFLKTAPLYLFFSFIVIGFILGSPYWIIELQENLKGLAWELGRLNAENSGSDFFLSKIPYLWIFSELVIREKILGLTMVLSIFYSIYLLFKKDKTALLLTPFILVSILLIGKYQKHSLHYMLPVFPVLVLLCATVFDSWIEKQKPLIKRLTIGFIVVITFFPFHNFITYSLSHLKQDARLQASNWIQNNIPTGSTIAVGKTSFSAPLPDKIRFEKKFYSSIGEQVMAQKLPEIHKSLYKENLDKKGYNLVNYIIKQSVGRTGSFSQMMKDIKILPFDDIIQQNAEYLIVSSMDLVYYKKEGKTSLLDFPEYKEHLLLLKSFAKKDLDQFVQIYKIIPYDQQD